MSDNKVKILSLSPKNISPKRIPPPLENENNNGEQQPKIRVNVKTRQSAIMPSSDDDGPSVDEFICECGGSNEDKVRDMMLATQQSDA